MATNHLAMSDEDFLNELPPERVEVPKEASDPTPENQTEAKPEGEVEAPVVIEEKPADTPAAEEPVVENNPLNDPDDAVVKPADKPVEEPKPEDKPEAKPAEGESNPEAKPADKKPEGEPKDTKPTGSEEKPEAATAEFKPPSPEEAQAFFMKVMTPIKANGKTIQLKTPEEAIALMQMGANYTRKLQELAPSRKLITMLQNNDLLDESKISFLIDLDKKNPEAIKKLIKESGIDPLEIDTNIEPDYQEGSHRVTDAEVNFRTTLEDLSASDTGKQTIIAVNTTWDQTSKDMAFVNPEVLPVIHEQRESGIYDLITVEMDRQKALGKIAPAVPFLEAYKIVGDQLYEAGAFKGLIKEEAPVVEAKPDPVVPPAAAEEKSPVATRAAAPKPVVDNGDKAGAASPTRAAPGKAKEVKNFLSMSDEDFLKSEEFRGRV